LLWSRSDVPEQVEIFHDDLHLFLVETGDQVASPSTRALRLADGSAVRIPDFSALYPRRKQAVGGTLLLADQGEKGTLLLRQYDVLSGKDLWNKTFAAGTLLLTSEETLAGVVGPDGKLTVFDLAAHKELFIGTMKPSDLARVCKAYLFHDRQLVYVACERPYDGVVPDSVEPNLMPWTGLRSRAINGALYAFDASSGRTAWVADASNQHLLLTRLNEMPVLVMTSRYARDVGKDQPAKGTLSRQNSVVATRVLDKRTGKVLYEKEDTTEGVEAFHALRLDMSKGTVELLSSTLKLRIEPATGKPSP
jgi:hypothetical protein